jgi:hypothetical protein
VVSAEEWEKPRMRMVAGALRSWGRETVWPSSAVPVEAGMVAAGAWRVRRKAAKRMQGFMVIVETLEGRFGLRFDGGLMG